MLKRVWLLCIVLMTGPVFAQSWTAGTADDSEYLYAVVMNDSDVGLGQFCYPGAGHCLWMLILKTRCDQDTKAPVLMSSSAGAAAVDVLCRGPHAYKSNTWYRYVLADFDMVDAAVRGGGIVGFAMALESGQFRVSRFSTQGASAVLDRMRGRAEAMRDRIPSRGTRDSTL